VVKIVFRFSFVATGLWRAVCAAWWDSWLGFWGFVADEHDPDHKRDQRAMERDHLDAEIVDGGGFAGFAANSGGDW